MIRNILYLVVCVLLLLAENLVAQEEITNGYVSGIRGKAYKFGIDGIIVPLKVGDTFSIGDFIATEKRSRIQIRFDDNTIVTLGESATIKLSDYMWSAEKQKGRFKLNITEGFFRIIGGKITKNSPKDFIAKTPVASIGIRGSSYAGQQSKSGLLVFLESGKGIDVYNSRGSVALLSPGKGTRVNDKNSRPSKARFFHSNEIKQILQQSSVESNPESIGSRISGTATIINDARVTNTTNIASGKNNTARVGSINIRGSEVSGQITNSVDISDSANISEGSNNEAHMGTIDVD